MIECLRLAHVSCSINSTLGPTRRPHTPFRRLSVEVLRVNRARARLALLDTIAEVNSQERTKCYPLGALGHATATRLAAASMVHSARAV